MTSPILRRSAWSLLPIAGLLLLWELASYLVLRSGTMLPQSKLPFPHKVLAAFAEHWALLGKAALLTFGTALVGFAVGGLFGFLLAVLLSSYRRLESGILPYVVASQMIPIIGLAPIVYGILHKEILAKVFIATYVTFFPVAINTLRGLKSTDPNALDLLTSYAAPKWMVYWKLKIPASLPGLFTGLKIAATASVIGAILVELMGAQNGLGVLILRFMYYGSSHAFQLWATIIAAALLGIFSFKALSGLERLLVPWQPEFRPSDEEAEI